MASTSPGYGITIRVEGPPSAQPVAEVTTAITAAGAAITALDVVESFLDHVVIDVTCDAIDAEHAEAITAMLNTLKQSLHQSQAIPNLLFVKLVTAHSYCTSVAKSKFNLRFH